MGSGLLWFFLGAGAATMYAKRQSHLEAGHGPWGQWHGCHGHFNHAPASHSPLPSSQPSQAPPPSSQVALGQPVVNNTASPSPSYQSSAAADNSFFPSAPWSRRGDSSGSPTGVQNDPWAAEKERMREIGNQVGVNVIELSETTLDTLLSSIESMKARVVQQRIERERAEAERQRIMEEQRMNPPRFV